MLQIKHIICGGWLLLLSLAAQAATYYVDYANGSDTNAGTKVSPWQRAPGMRGCANICASTTVNAGDSIILKGCVSWLNAVAPWRPTYSGTNGSPVYIGVDATWWDSTVSGCASAWGRPIINMQGLSTDRGDSLEIVFDNRAASYITWDNFEIINWLTQPDATPGNRFAELYAVSSASAGANNNIIQNMYVHAWINPYISIGTGNLTNGSCVISNYVPYSYSPSPAAGWVIVGGGVRVQSLPQGTNIPIGNSDPTLSALSGSNPYTVTFTSAAGGAGCASATVTGAVIQIGLDAGIIVSGNTAGDTGTIVQNNVFDGSDTAEALWNPYSDCGLTEGNNQACMASVTVGRYGPQIWRNNVLRYVSNGFIGSSTELSGNLLENFRLGTDPTGHTNVWEEEPALGTTNLYYNNVIRHMNFPNPNIPGGTGNIGVPLMISPPDANSTAYVFNNVMYDMTINTAVQINGLESLLGTVKLWNNTIFAGPQADATHLAFTCTTAHCVVQNNHAITTANPAFGTCGAGCTLTTNRLSSGANSASTEAGNGYTSAETFAFAPSNSSAPTAGAGTSITSLCNALSGAAKTACQSDTTYGAYYAAGHAAVSGVRSAIVRPSTPSQGAYEFSSVGSLYCCLK